MKGLRTAGVLWLVAAAFAVAITLSFRTDPVEWVVTMAVGVVVAILGLWLVARSSAPGRVRIERRQRGVDRPLCRPHLAAVR